MTRLDQVVIFIKDLISDVVALCILVSPELCPKCSDCLLLLIQLQSMGVHLPLKPGHPPLHPNGDLRLLSHKLAHVHPLNSCLDFHL